MQAAVTTSRRSVKAHTMTVMSSTPPSAAEPLSVTFSIAQRSTLAAVAPTSPQLDRVAASLQPYAATPGDGDPPDVLVAFDRPLDGEVSEHLGDTGDGLHTSWDGHGLRIVHEGASCRLSFGGSEAAALVELEDGFPWWRAWSAAVRPLLSIPIAARGAAVTHASAVTHEGRGIAIAGWSESGKTEVALALCERGARFVSDKWTALADDGSLHAMPVPAGLRAWTVPHLPQLRQQPQPRAARAGGGRPHGRGRRRARRRARGRPGGDGRVRGRARRGGAGEPGVAVARGAHRRRRRAAAAARTSTCSWCCGPRRATPRATELDADTACRRLLTTTAYERRALDALDARSRYLRRRAAFPATPSCALARRRSCGACSPAVA